MSTLYNAITPPTLVLAGLRGAISQEISNLSFVYDPSLDWTDAAKAERAKRAMLSGTGESADVPTEDSNPSQYPLLAWNRSTLIPTNERSRRNVFGAIAPTTINGTQWNLQAFVGEMIFAFKIYSRDILELEALEAGYVARSLISDITGFDIQSSAFGLDSQGNSAEPFHYDVQWDPLDPQISVQRLPVMLFGIEGKATVRGLFLTGSQITSYPVNTIDLKIQNYQNLTLDEIIVHR